MTATRCPEPPSAPTAPPPHPRTGRSAVERRATPARSDGTGATSPAAGAAARPGGFLVSPAVDLLFIANLFWPLLLMVDIFGGVATHESLLFWQIYFVTAPHRWITLVLVTMDREKTSGRQMSFIALGVGILLACLCLRFGTGSLLCLGVVDYVWNAWHFSSQHHGIFRIYERKNAAGRSRGSLLTEKIAFRAFLLYTIARVAGWGWSEGPFTGSEFVAPLDWFCLAVPVFFVGRQLARWLAGQGASLAGFAYMTSVMSLFSAMLLAAHFQRGQLVIQLALASAVFHSLEYMSIVTWSMQRPRKSGSTSALAYLSRTWVLFLAVFVLVIGAGNYLLSRGYFELWVLTNLIVAFWHYGFDGMIWKSPKRAAAPTAAAGAGS